MARRSSSDLPSRERGVPVDVLNVDRFLLGLLEGSGELVRTPVVLVFRPVSSPNIRPQEQLCARVGTISPVNATWIWGGSSAFRKKA